MANIAPALDLNLYLLKELEFGTSLKQALIKYVTSKTETNGMVLDIVEILRHQESETEFCGRYFMATSQRKWLLVLIERGLLGEPVYSQLEKLQKELVKQSFEEIEEDADRLPFVCLLPLFFFMVPSFLLILVFPLIWEFLSAQ